MSDTKRRQHFQVEDICGDILAFGVLYDEGNVQLAWRHSVGWTQEQHASIATMIGIEAGMKCIRLLPHAPYYRTDDTGTDYTDDMELETIIIKEDKA